MHDSQRPSTRTPVRHNASLILKLACLAALLTAISSSAWARAVNLILPVDRVITVAQSAGCLTEDVQLTGTLKLLFVDTLMRDGDRVTIVTNWQGVTGTGLVSGTNYQATSITQTTVFFVGEPPFSRTLASGFNIIGQGEANNLLVHENVRFTTNANGVVTAEVDNLNVSCR